MLEAIRQYFKYLHTVSELSQLSNRELRDIGVYRGDINRVAWAATVEEAAKARVPERIDFPIGNRAGAAGSI